MRQWRVLEVIFAVVLAACLFWTGAYWMERLLFLAMGALQGEPTEHRGLAAIMIIFSMGWLLRLPHRLARLSLQTGRMTMEDFASWRNRIEAPWVAFFVGTLAATGFVWAILGEWSSRRLLLALPLAAVAHLRSFLRLPDSTDPRNRLEVDKPLR